RMFTLAAPGQNIYPIDTGIGQGMQLAIGASFAHAGRKVLAMCGDGGFFLNVCELWTAVQERCDVVFLVMNDGGYGVIRKIQDAQFEGRRFYDDLLIPDLGDFARVAGLPHWRCQSVEQVGAALEAAFAGPAPALVEVAMKHHPTGNVALLPDIPFTGSDDTSLPDALTQATGTRLMYVGNLESYQGIDLMLDAFARVADTHDNAVLLIVGSTEQLPAFDQQWDELSRRRAVLSTWHLQPGQVLDKATLAYMLRTLCDLPRSLNETLASATGLGDRRYALRTCIDGGLLPYGRPHDPVTGGELLSALTRAQDCGKGGSNLAPRKP
ncbi:MAG: glycosyltransferase, partial [Planctomycetes bacterium]|nr:glycosyltransferase [Planctomycetota bacterium]